jgi:hypothetical protein
MSFFGIRVSFLLVTLKLWHRNLFGYLIATNIESIKNISAGAILVQIDKMQYKSEKLWTRKFQYVGEDRQYTPYIRYIIKFQRLWIRLLWVRPPLGTPKYGSKPLNRPQI